MGNAFLFFGLKVLQDSSGLYLSLRPSFLLILTLLPFLISVTLICPASLSDLVISHPHSWLSSVCPQVGNSSLTHIRNILSNEENKNHTVLKDCVFTACLLFCLQTHLHWVPETLSVGGLWLPSPCSILGSLCAFQGAFVLVGSPQAPFVVSRAHGDPVCSTISLVVEGTIQVLPKGQMIWHNFLSVISHQRNANPSLFQALNSQAAQPCLQDPWILQANSIKGADRPHARALPLP